MEVGAPSNCSLYQFLTVRFSSQIFDSVSLILGETSVSVRTPPASPFPRCLQFDGTPPPTPTPDPIPDPTLPTTHRNPTARSPLPPTNRPTPPPTPPLPTLLLPPAFRSEALRPSRRAQPRVDPPAPTAPPRAAPYRIPRSAPLAPSTPPRRRTAVLRERETRQGSRLSRLVTAATIVKQRKIWKCSTCQITLTSAKAKLDHLGGRRHKARLQAQEDYRCEPCNLNFLSAADLDRHRKGRRHFQVVARSRK